MISPKARRDARQRALQFMFGLEFTRYDWQSAIEEFWDDQPARPAVRSYAETLIRGVAENIAELDDAIRSAVENWNPDRIGHIERNILRIALYEMRHTPDVPGKVAINEAIELAKRFAADEATRFINGVLDRLKGD